MKIVSVAPVVPYEGIPHAGGQYYLRHVLALAGLGHDVTLVAPDGEENRAARARATAGLRVVLFPVPERPLFGQRFAGFFERQQQRFFPVRPVRRVRRGFATSSEVRSLVRAADAVEFQWTEMGWLGTQKGLGARRVVFAHDVLLQNAERFLAASGGGLHPRAVVARLRLLTVRRDERRVYRKADNVLVFSRKDAALVRRLAGDDAAVRVVRPPLAPVRGRTDVARPTDGTILFVGAFDRSVNSDAALWAMREIVPRVRRRHPSATFVFAGAHPTADMLSEAAREPDAIVVTGRVHSLDDHYARAAVALIPLRAGAGVKFKTVDALVRGVPVVSTTIGVEGIVDDTLSVFAVADDAGGLADGLCAVLDDPVSARHVARTVQAAAVEEFSEERLLLTLTDVYGPADPD